MALLRPCKTTAAYEAVPTIDGQVDLDELERLLEERGWSTVANAHVLLVMAKDEEATFYPSGKVLIKTTDEAAAQRVWGDVDDLLLASGAEYEG